jgi:hypothetical protein
MQKTTRRRPATWVAQTKDEDMNTDHTHGTAGIVAPAEGRELSYGEKAVGLGFNPGANPEVYACKAGFAVEIDRMNDLRNATTDNEVKRMASVAITELQTAQMWAVKAITWKS